MHDYDALEITGCPLALRLPLMLHTDCFMFSDYRHAATELH